MQRACSVIAKNVAACVRRHGVLVAACLVLSGCITGYEKSDLLLEVPDNYRYAPRRPDAALPALDWWRGFRSHELISLIEAAQTENLDIAAAVARIVQADGQVRVSGAPLLPLIGADASVIRSRGARTVSGDTVTVSSRSPTTQYNASLSASYEIDFWGKNRAALLASEQNAVASRYDREVVTLTTLASVANTYFQVLAAQDRLRIARDNLAAANRVLALVRQRFLAGTASQLDVAQQESLVATQKAVIPVLEISLRQGMAALAVLIGRAPENVSIRGGSMNAVRVPVVTPGLPSDLLNQRPDIRLAEAALASANYNVESARAAFFPSIALTGQTGFQSLALASLFGPGAWFYTMAAAIAQPVFDGFLLLGQFEIAKGRQQELLQLYRKAVLSAFSDVEQALIALEQQTTRERLQTEVIRASRQAFDLSEQRLREGTVDLVTVLTTQQTLFQAQDTLAQVRFARLQAVVGLFQALGGGWPPLVRHQAPSH
ncbi:MAG TPA: efflux transporter outer membrane subunit [Xanthobacteraceae bacterium]|nr:efflux transporter outer membrane subunit [Xanthobacteraceae bacterium]